MERVSAMGPYLSKSVSVKVNWVEQLNGFCAAALFSGASLGEAAALAAADGFDPGAHLVGLIEAGAFQSPISQEP